MLPLGLLLALLSLSLQAQDTERGQLRYLTVSGVTGQLAPPAGSTDPIVFSFDRSGYRILVTIPRSLSEGQRETGTGTRKLSLRLPAEMEIYINGTAAQALTASISVLTSGVGKTCSESRQFQAGQVIMSAKCSLSEIASFSGSAVDNGIIPGFWFIQVTALNQLITVSPTYEFPIRQCPQGCDEPDLAITQIQAIQVVQNLEGSVPLIPDKETIVRVFSRSVGADRVLGPLVSTLDVFGSGACEYRHLSPVNLADVYARTFAPDVGNENHSANFVLPPECTKPGTIRVLADVDANIPEKNRENNVVSKSLTFDKELASIPLTIDYWGIRFDGEGCPEMFDSYERVQMMLPIADGKVTFTPLHLLYDCLDWKDIGSRENAVKLQRQLGRVLARLRGQGTAHKLFLAVPGRSYNPNLYPEQHIVQEWCPDRFCGGRNSEAFASTVVSYFNALVGHPGLLNEILGQAASAFNPRTNRIFAPRTDIDGSLIFGGWIKPDEYAGALAAFLAITKLSSPPVAIAAERAGVIGGETDTLMVSGFAAADGSSGRLDPAFRFSRATPDPSDPNGGWCLRARRSGGPDTDTCFALSFPDAATEASFTVEIPWFADLTSVILFRRDAPGNELAVLNAADPITLSFSSPQQGDIWEGKRTVAWTGVESAGRSLTYMLLYSNDGGVSWMPLSINLREPKFDIDAARLPGGTRVHFRLMASSGITNSVLDAGPVEIRQSPQFQIVPGGDDFGNRNLGELSQGEITIRNTGTGPLLIDADLPADSPFSLVPGFTQVLVAAGQERSIPVRFRPATLGQHETELRLTGGGITERVTIRGAAYDRPVSSIQAPAAIDFGGLPVGSTRDLRLLVRNDGRAPLTIQSVSVSSTVFQPTNTTMEIPAGGEASLVLRLRVTAQTTYSARVTIRSNDPRRGSIEVAVSANGIVPTGPSIDVFPAILDFGSVAVNSFRTSDLTIANLGTTPVTVTAITSSNPRFTLSSPALPVTIPPGAQRVAVIRFAPVSTTAETGTLTITSDDPASPSIVTLRSSGAAATGGIEVTPSSLDFGNVAVNQTRDQTLTIRNGSSSPLTVTELTSNNARFTVFSAPTRPFGIAAGASATVTIRFSPTVAGASDGALTIRSSDSARPTVVLSLSGTGTAGGTTAPGNFAGTWNTEDSGAITYQVFVTQTGSQVTGTYPQFNGTIEGTVTGNILNGRWAYPGTAGTFTWTLSADGNRFTGSWIRTSGPGGISGTWNGTRASTPSAPVIAVSTQGIDFGVVTLGSSPTRTLTITNTGTSTLTISSLATSAPFSVSPTSVASIAAGASSTATITFAPTGAGAFTRSLTIASNDPARPTVTVTLNGTVSGTTPPSNFGGQWTGTSGGNSYSMTITQNGTSVSGTYPQYNGSISGSVNGNTLTGTWSDVSGNGTFTFTLSADGQSFTGTWVRTSAGGGSGTWNGTRVASSPSISVSTQSIDFGLVALGASPTRTLTITNNGTAALNIASLTTSAPFTVSPASVASLAAGASTTATITFAPTGVGSFTRNLTITSNDPARPSLTVALSGSVGGTTPANFDGQWTTTSSGNTYALTIVQNGSTVTGTYPQYSGAITGTVNGNTLTGTWNDVSGSGTFTFTLSADGQSFTGTWVRTSGGGGSGNWNGTRAAQSVVLSVDDGSFESVIGFPQGGNTGYFVNRLTPPRYPATLRAVQIYFSAGELPAGTTFNVLSAAHPSGSGATPLTNVAWQMAPAQITTRGQFVEFMVAPITITSGDFLVGFSVANPVNIYPASIDTTPTAKLRSYIGTSATSIRFPAEANQGNLGIRARID
ncbi:MAG: choice-of-anchor D domain-containing protein [Acidobacteria bacterium]|nr:choice-of-anchor D domain-containing protein [Acidobacteriota bacterium]